MISRRLVLSSDFSKMASELSFPLISPFIVQRIPGFQQKNRLSRVMAVSGSRFKNFSSQKSGLFSGARASRLQENFFLFGERCFDYSNLSVNLRRKQSFASITARISENVSVSNPTSHLDGHLGTRVSRMGRMEAQNALFDYLHYTRGFNFTDAEHISRNSPNFIQKLISKFENAEDVGKSLARFLRYHPINEFEPFFESLGLKPSELYPLLPRNLIFLADDTVLLENYHFLCNYGVPRSKIGKIFKEAMEAFRYDYGILSLKLQAYEELRLSRPTIIKLVICCPTLLIGEVNVEFLQVLDKLKTLGIEVDWLRGCLSDKSTYKWNRILEMLDFLDRVGCTKVKLVILMSANPRFIFDDSGKKFYILVAMLLKLGFKMNSVLDFFVQNPRILAGNFARKLLQSMQFLSEIGMESKDITKVVSTHPLVFGSCSCCKSSVLLKSLNMASEDLCQIILEDPSQFSNLACRKKGTVVNFPRVEGSFLQEKTNFLLKLGFVENSDEMGKALRKFRGRGDQLQERFDCLVKVGLDYHTVSQMVKLVPPVLNQSVGVIEKKMDYLLNHLGYPLEALATFPTYLCYNMKRIKLRFSMFNWLVDHGVVRPNKNQKIANSTVALSSILAVSETRFVKYYVSHHPEGPKEWDRLKKSSSLS